MITFRKNYNPLQIPFRKSSHLSRRFGTKRSSMNNYYNSSHSGSNEKTKKNDLER